MTSKELGVDLNGRRRLRRFLEVCLFSIFILALSSFATCFTDSVTGVAAFWPVNAFALVMMLRWAKSRADIAVLILVLFLTTWAANVISAAPPPLALGFAATNVFEATLGAWLARGFRTSKFESVGDGWKFFALAGPVPIALASVLATVVTASIGDTNFWRNLFTWAAADFLGFVLIAPMGMTISLQGLRRIVRQRAWWEAAAVSLVVLSVTGVVFMQRSLPLLFLVMPFVLIASFRYGQMGANVSTLLIAAVAVPLSAKGFGPISLVHTDFKEAPTLVLQLFLAANSLTSIPVAAAVDERNYMVALARKKSSELTESNQELRRSVGLGELAENVADAGHWCIDLPSGLHTWSPGVFEIFGLPVKHQPPAVDSVISMYRKEHRERIQTMLADAIAGNTGLEFETVITRLDGTRRDVRVRARYFDDGNGRGSLLGVVRDITAERAATAALAESERRFRAIAETAGDLIIQTTRRGTITYASPASVAVTGWPCDELEGTNGLAIIVPEDIAELSKQFDHELSMPHQRGWRTSYRILTPLRQTRWLEASSRQLLDADGSCVGMISVVRDDTARKKMEADLLAAREAAEKGAEAKANFLANMSHEIRTPLNCIIGFSNLISEAAELAPETLRRAKLVEESSHALLAVVNDILDVSKIDAEGVALNPVATDLNTLLERVVAIISADVRGKSLRFDLEVSNLPRHVQIDPTRFRQVLFNLLSNAVKFSSSGSITLKVSGSKTGEMLVSVTDSGIGIPAERTTQIFERFEQADQTTERKFGGTGLGLHISKAIIEAMGGKIGVQSAEGVGSTFWFKIPLIPVDAEAEDQSQPASRARNESQLKVLLADDNATNRDLFTAILVGVDVQIVTVENGDQALKAALKEEFDIIFMDVHMPIMDGLTATRELRARGVSSPIIALTADVLPRNVRECEDAGMTALLAKPYKPAELFSALQSAIGDQE